MENKQISLEQLSDIYAFRVVVDTIDDCYRVLGVAHTTWRTVPGRFKDYISTPKQNNYQSIHTTVVGPAPSARRAADPHARDALDRRVRRRRACPLQGCARSVNGGEHRGERQLPQLDKDNGPYVWLRRLVETLLEGANPEEFLEHTKLELFQDQVFCFTPKGRLIALPRGATPLDFAYAVHTDVGNAAVGAYVNGRHVPIDTRLRNGDEVRDPDRRRRRRRRPPGRASPSPAAPRSAIRRAARDAMRRQYAELGRRLLIGRASSASARPTATSRSRRCCRSLGRRSSRTCWRAWPQRDHDRRRRARHRARMPLEAQAAAALASAGAQDRGQAARRAGST